MLSLLGLTPEQIAENEEWDPKKGKRTRDFGDRVGDGLMSILTGTNYGDRVKQATKDQYVDTVTDAYGNRINKTKGVAGYDDIGDVSRLSDLQIKQELGNREATKSARSKVSALYGVDRGQLLDVTDAGEIEALGARLGREKDEAKVEAERLRLKKEKDADNERADERYNLERSDNLTRQKENDRRYYQERADALELKRDDLMFRREEAIRSDARLQQDRKDKAIAMLFNGLGNLGTAFTA